MAVEDPDVLDAALAPWKPVALAARFEIEDARLGSGAGLTGAAAAGGRIARSRLDGVALSGSRLRSLRLIDVVLSEADVSNADWAGAHLTRVLFDRCRMTGFAGPELQAEHLTLRGCKLDLANLRGAAFRRVSFEDCVLDDADLGGAAFREARFSGCSLRGTLIDEARLAGVDFRGSRLEPEGDVLALRGAIVDPVQLVELGPLLARGLGIVVRDG